MAIRFGNIPKARREISPEKKKKKKKKLEKNFFLSGILHVIFFSDSMLDMKLILFFLDSSRRGGKISLRGHPSRIFSFLVIYWFLAVFLVWGFGLTSSHLVRFWKTRRLWKDLAEWIKKVNHGDFVSPILFEILGLKVQKPRIFIFFSRYIVASAYAPATKRSQPQRYFFLWLFFYLDDET